MPRRADGAGIIDPRFNFIKGTVACADAGDDEAGLSFVVEILGERFPAQVCPKAVVGTVEAGGINHGGNGIDVAVPNPLQRILLVIFVAFGGVPLPGVTVDGPDSGR